MRLKTCLAIAALLCLLTACSGLSKRDGNTWLDTKAGPTNENMNGHWTTVGDWTASWGEGNFIQDGSRFYGHLGSYTVDGAINGERIYLTFTSGRKLYYSAMLRKNSEGGYSGRAVQGTLIDQPGAEDGGITLINLRRVGR